MEIAYDYLNEYQVNKSTKYQDSIENGIAIWAIVSLHIDETISEKHSL